MFFQKNIDDCVYITTTLYANSADSDSIKEILII